MLSEFCFTYQKNNGVLVYNSLHLKPVFLSFKEWLLLSGNGIIPNNKLDILKTCHILDSNAQNMDYINRVYDLEKNCSGVVDVLYLVLTESCNLRCLYCMVKNGNYSEGFMSKEIYEKSIKLFAQSLATKKIRNGKIIIYGGEPLMAGNELKDCISFINAVSKQFEININIGLITNGTLLNEEWIDYFNKKNVDIGISLDGSKEQNDRQRRFSGNDKSVFDTVIESIELLNAHNAIYGVSTCIGSETEVLDFVKWYRRYNIKNFTFNLLHYNSFNKQWKQEYELIVSKIFDLYNFFLLDEIYEEKMARRLSSILNDEPIVSECAAAGCNQLVVFPYGEIGVCHVDRVKSGLPNIKGIKSFEDIMSTDVIKKWAKKTTWNNAKCQKCKALMICGGGCGMQEQILNCKTNVDESFCIYAKTFVDWYMSMF